MRLCKSCRDGFGRIIHAMWPVEVDHSISGLSVKFLMRVGKDLAE